MKPHYAKQRNHALTSVEVLVVIVTLMFVLVLLAKMFLPELAVNEKRAMKISCENNLKQVALAVKVWAGDNNDKYAMQVSVTNGGAREWMLTSNAWKVFGVMSNELSTAKIIYCPQDALHGRPATNFTDDLQNRISYFIGAEAMDADPQLLLAGDDNFLLNQKPVPPGPLDPAYNATLEWDLSRHTKAATLGWLTKAKSTGSGNIALADGSVQSATSSGLTNLLQQASLATNRLVIP